MYKKMFFPIGGGDELEHRLYGAMLVAKYFKVNLEILKSQENPNNKISSTIQLPDYIKKEIEEVLKLQLENEHQSFYDILNKVALDLDIKVSSKPLANEASVYAKTKDGLRSILVEQASKFCDLVVASSPPSGISTATFESAVLKSGKSVLMIPRIMRVFDTKNIIIGWNNSTEVSRSLTSSMDILKQAQRVHIVTSKQYSSDLSNMNSLVSYLKCHDVDASYEFIKTTRIPGQALLNASLDGNFDLIVAGAYGHKGLRELMFGGATRYLLENSTLPVFMSH